MPAERLLVETDAPYLSPQAVRGERNQPAYVLDTLRFVAALRGVDPRSSGGRRGATPRASSAGLPRARRAQLTLGACRASACGPIASSASTS